MFALSLFLLLTLPALASPFAQPRSTKIVYDPHITYPTANVTWNTGKSYILRWNASDIPDAAYNYTGKVYLGYLEQGTDEHLDIEHPLAEGFLIRSGHVSVNIPEVEPRTDYIVALLGDAANISPQFTIVDSCSS